MKYKDVVNNIKGMLERAESPITSHCCIYRVPFDIRLLNQDAYTLKDIFIGPFHQHNPRLQNMERHKLIYFNKFLELGDVNLESLVIHVEEAEPNLRRSYADTLDLTKEELEKIILFYYNEWSKADAFPLKPWLTTNIRLDLVLIENQLPFFVLESLYNRALISGSGNIPSFLILTFDYFAYCNSCNLDSDNIIIRHFIDLLRMFHLQQPIERWSHSRKESLVHLNSASELVETGVKFKLNTKTKCLLDLKFSWDVFEIPQFRVEDGTKLLIHNLVALEQCHYPYESYITNYVAILDFHINSNRDVDALIENDVLVNCLGDTDSVTNVYNGLWKNITHLNFSSNYIHLCLDLNVFCSICDVVNDIKGMLDRAQSPCCIYSVVSIGPFHHHNPRLQNMERVKLIYFNKFLELGEINLESLVSMWKRLNLTFVDLMLIPLTLPRKSL
ncbi:hypothetical protein Lalb_Chr13g0292491 [Lupinus albus]|uniref:Uncharacterized protein n=1 Tax=Lupinus albus TaxID=3870 RepID=A0A6A4PHM8_LUPAL|nr:hypothetical protein Lalb_Chr13g0292491 [Lupinus albus]